VASAAFSSIRCTTDPRDEAMTPSLYSPLRQLASFRRIPHSNPTHVVTLQASSQVPLKSVLKTTCVVYYADILLFATLYAIHCLN
jgi:hypothetical protein